MNSRLSLSGFALLAFACLLTVSWWATSTVDIRVTLADVWNGPAAGNNPWLIATMFDAYFGFLWFWLWLAYREASWVARVLWLLLILSLDNIAMATYVLMAIRRLPPGAPATALFSKGAAA